VQTPSGVVRASTCRPATIAERSFMSIVVVAAIVPLPEHWDSVVAAFERAVARVHAEDVGCELYALNEGVGHLVMIEKWGSDEDLAVHAAGPAVAELNQTIEGKLVRPTDVQRYVARPAGTARQGVL
jgi:quinol monooxygenase YgiN